MPLIDLREHFGVWERCGNTRFWRVVNWRETVYPFSRHLFLNPIDGVMIYAHDYPEAGGPALEVTVRDGGLASGEDLQKVYPRMERWIGNALRGLLTEFLMIRIGLLKGTPLSFFLKKYKDQTEHFTQTGEGHQNPGKDEVLAATKAALGGLGEKTLAVLHKVILKEEWDEFLADYGILEC
jgi:hypothetical protein